MIAQLPFTRVVLEPDKKSSAVREFEAMLSARIVGQDEVVSQMVNVYQTVLAGMTVPERPIANLLFLGPTGSGKTRIVEASAELLLGSPAAMIKVDCAEFQHSHEIAKLIGSPPGYLGHRETPPVLTQQALDRLQNEKIHLSFVPAHAPRGGLHSQPLINQELFRFPAAIAPSPPRIITALKAGCTFSSCRVSTPRETPPTEMPPRSVRGIGTTKDTMPRTSTTKPMKNKTFI